MTKNSHDHGELSSGTIWLEELKKETPKRNSETAEWDCESDFAKNSTAEYTSPSNPSIRALDSAKERVPLSDDVKTHQNLTSESSTDKKVNLSVQPITYWD